MTTVICTVENCPYKSKKPLKKYKMENGGNCYQCKLDMIIISNLFDPDGETYGLFGYTPAECRYYAKHRESQNG